MHYTTLREQLLTYLSPGEILPKMPKPTHSENGGDGLKPFVTVNETLTKIPPDAANHDPDRLIFAEGRGMRPWEGNKILPRAMTTSGGQNYHPSGTRDFTLREYACLQGFPLNHVFMGTGIKKQIGNAVPPCVAAVLFKSIKRDLDEADGVVDSQDIIMID
jgi:DNA (cytosine-5)-methyltransferase 1